MTHITHEISIPLSVTMLFFLALLTAAGATTTTAAAELAPVPAPAAVAWLRRPLAERLDVDGEGSRQCWETLMHIKSCTGEIILFFLDGEAYLGPGCCRAIRVIEQRCWGADAVLFLVGFTPQEGDMLKGYCDAGGQAPRQHGSPPPPCRAVDDGDAATIARESVVGSAAGRKQGPVRGR